MVKRAAQKYSVIAVMTGKTDYVSDGKKVFSITGGSEYLALITGAGCLHTAACASFLSLKKDPLILWRNFVRSINKPLLMRKKKC